ncbi:hypothetical protein L7F22_062929 [Adiantum nelumboides]|nr:hypothetical protein [Adiantum nelumboides]
MGMDDSELQRRVHEHRLFFDKLVELVPPKIYIAKDDEENNWHYGMSKAQRAAAKQATKENLKKAKRDRLDPDKFTSTVELLQQRSETSIKPENDKAEAGTSGKLQGKESRAATYEELRERLHKRMELLRAKRNADAAAATAKKARSWKNENKQSSQKRKRNDSLPGSHTNTDVLSPSLNRPKQGLTENESGVMKKKIGVKAAVDSFEFGRVKMGLPFEANRRSRKRRKESKEQLLAKATKLQSEMQDPTIGQDASLKHSWSAALNRSSGEKVYDDPSLLKQSLKREKHQRQKSSKKWEERKETVKQSVEAKQQTRQGHIKDRKQQKLEKKISKREKKLLRPGFEGRREKFINQ